MMGYVWRRIMYNPNSGYLPRISKKNPHFSEQSKEKVGLRERDR